MKAEHAIRGAYGTTTSVRESEPMTFFLTEGLGAELLQSDGAHHQFQLGDEGHGRMFELVEEPELPQGSWNFGEGTIHHQALDAVTAENQATVKDGSSGWASPTSKMSRTGATFSRSTCAAPAGR